MNEILAIIVQAFFSEVTHGSIFDSDSDEETHELDAKKVFHTLHDINFVWADIYLAFDRVMNLGVKELYYKEISEAVLDVRRQPLPKDKRERKRLEL